MNQTKGKRAYLKVENPSQHCIFYPSLLNSISLFDFSIHSVRDFTTKILESEQRVHLLINNASIQWVPLKRTAEGHEFHWGYNHLAHFAMTQLLMPLLLR